MLAEQANRALLFSGVHQISQLILFSGESVGATRPSVVKSGKRVGLGPFPQTKHPKSSFLPPGVAQEFPPRDGPGDGSSVLSGELETYNLHL